MWGDFVDLDLLKIMKSCSGSRVPYCISGSLLHLRCFIKLLHLGVHRQYPISPIIKLASQSMHPWKDISKLYTILLHFDPKWEKRPDTDLESPLFSAIALNVGVPQGFVPALLLPFFPTHSWKISSLHAFNYLLMTPICYL